MADVLTITILAVLAVFCFLLLLCIGKLSSELEYYKAKFRTGAVIGSVTARECNGKHAMVFGSAYTVRGEEMMIFAYWENPHQLLLLPREEFGSVVLSENGQDVEPRFRFLTEMEL